MFVYVGFRWWWWCVCVCVHISTRYFYPSLRLPSYWYWNVLCEGKRCMISVYVKLHKKEDKKCCTIPLPFLPNFQHFLVQGHAWLISLAHEKVWPEGHAHMPDREYWYLVPQQSHQICDAFASVHHLWRKTKSGKFIIKHK